VSGENQRSTMSVAAGLEVSLAMVSPNQQLVDLSSAVAEVSRSLVDFRRFGFGWGLVR
jgi:hypothetical protein